MGFCGSEDPAAEPVVADEGCGYGGCVVIVEQVGVAAHTREKVFVAVAVDALAPSVRRASDGAQVGFADVYPDAG